MAIDDVRMANALTDDQLKRALTAEGWTWEDYRKKLGEQIRKAKLLSRVVRRELTITEEALKRYYGEHIERFKEPDQTRASHILIAIPQDADDLLVEALRHKGEMILERLSRGEDFGELARSYSDDPSAKMGGDLGFFKPGDLLPEFDRVVFTLQSGQVSGLVRTKIGFHIIKVTGRKKGPAKPYEEVKDELRNQYVDGETLRLFKAWIQKVKVESIIEVRL
jgi:parvulin-like peptidyl-prolyl isomerase